MVLIRLVVIGLCSLVPIQGCAQPSVLRGEFCDVINRPETRNGDRIDLEAVLVWNENSGAVVTGPECPHTLYNADFDMSVSDERALISSLLRTPPTAGQAVQRTPIRIQGTIERKFANGGVLRITTANRMD
jgi:hypothetical protein